MPAYHEGVSATGSTISTRAMRTVVPVWVLALVGAVVVGVTAGSEHLTWLPVVLAASVIATMALQLALRRTQGLVTRMAASIGGALVILAIATGILALVDAAG